MPRIVPVKPIFSEKQILTHLQEHTDSINMLVSILMHKNHGTLNLAQYDGYQKYLSLTF